MNYIDINLESFKEPPLQVSVNGRAVTINTKNLIFAEIIMPEESELAAVNRALAGIKPEEWNRISFTQRTSS